MLIGKERHDLGRPNDWGYPVRALRTKDFLYVHNFQPDRWPACNPETDFGNCDPGPTKEVVKALGGHYYHLSFGRRPADELYDMRHDKEGVVNLANDLAYTSTLQELRSKMLALLKEDQDPRVLGNAAIFDTYSYVGGRAKGYETWLKAQEPQLAEMAAKAKAQAPADGARKAGWRKKQAATAPK
jgi:hypothetical protein